MYLPNGIIEWAASPPTARRGRVSALVKANRHHASDGEEGALSAVECNRPLSDSSSTTPLASGQVGPASLGEYPHLERERLPSYGLQLNVIEHFWKLLQRATPGRLYDTLADRKRSVRAGLCPFQTVRQRIKTLIATGP